MSELASERIELTAKDGFRCSAYRARPSTARGGGLVVVQEIFGVNDHIRQVATGFAEQGYEVIAPALYDRVTPGFETGYEADDVARARAVRAKVGLDVALLDVAAAVRALAPAGKVGIVGYCWGGTIAYLAAARLDGIHAAVGYYGAGIAQHVDEVPQVPTLLHFGERDPSIPAADVAQVRTRRPELELHVYPAGHGFSCDARGSYEPNSAALARERTLTFFERYLR